MGKSSAPSSQAPSPSSNSSAKHKKFGTQKDALQFVEKNRTTRKETAGRFSDRNANLDTYRRGGQLPTPIPKQTEGVHYTKDKEGRTRRSSPIAEYARHETLPDQLAKMAKQGWMFTATNPPRLVVYTDGSGLSNGTKRACAGAGVYWGDAEAGKHNLAERVPGKLQTNNRGELLVSPTARQS